MQKTLSFLCLLIFTSGYCFGQNLNLGKYRKLQGKKTGIYEQEGIFYKSGPDLKSFVQGIRHSGDTLKKQERVVVDFSTSELPKIYGYLSDSENLLYIDFFNTEIKDKISNLTNSPFVESINFYPWNDGTLTMEVRLKEKVYCDLFYLSSPGRFVFDIRKGP